MKYNILFVTNFFPDKCYGGIERVTDVLASHFYNIGIKCHCIYLYESENIQNKKYIICNFMQKMYDDIFLKTYILDNNIQIIINQSNPYYTPFLRLVCDSTKTKLITCLHNSTECRAQSYKDAVILSHGIKRILISVLYPLFSIYSSYKLRKTHRESCILSDITVLLSENLIKPYIKVLGLQHKQCNITYVNNPLSFRDSYDINKLNLKKKIVLVVARLYESQKKLSLLFQAWKIVERYNNEWKLIIVGDGPDRTKYESMANQFDLKNVYFEGKRDSYIYYNEASIFCMTSIWEGFPMTLLEAKQMGVVPIVMDSFPAVKDILNNNIDSYIVKYGDVETFASSISILMTDVKKLRQMQSNAILSSSRFNIDYIERKWIDIFNSLNI